MVWKIDKLLNRLTDHYERDHAVVKFLTTTKERLSSTGSVNRI